MYVSIHAPARGATTARNPGRDNLQSFNSRAREGRDWTASRVSPTYASFNSRAREGRDDLATLCTSNIRFVSIHAPARGATKGVGLGSRLAEFQFTRPRGARQGVIMRGLIVPCGFNSRAREGRDRTKRPFTNLAKCFNSRAREGRDHRASRENWRVSCFNSRAREGRDLAARKDGRSHDLFQFTRPRGARHQSGCNAQPPNTGFNSRAREGRDYRPAVRSSRWPSFNSRAREGRDRCWSCRFRRGWVSIHAPARGATFRPILVHPRPFVSIHAPARGAT